jgi:hypothetical protein
LSAECIGGTWSDSPTSVAQARSSSARATPTSATLVTTSAFEIAGGRRHAEAERREIALVGVEAGLRELGRGAEADRKQAARERVERAGVPRLLGAKAALGHLHRGVARDARVLVEQQHAVDGAPLDRGSRRGAPAGHGAQSSLARVAFALAISALSSAARSVVRSNLKCSVGTV